MKAILIDVDTGVDDALSIMLAVRSTQLDVLGITTVSGNVHVNEATKNTLYILKQIGASDIPVAKGMDAPLVRSLVTAEHVHGGSGLGEVNVGEDPLMKPEPLHGVDFIIGKIKESIDSVTILLLGPLTNMAAALKKDSTICENIEELVIMGGAGPAGGNITPAAEFNIYVDPESAKIVFGSGLSIRLITWDATLQAWLKNEEVELLAQSNDCAGVLAAEFIRFLQARFQNEQTALCDPAAAIALIEPKVAHTKRLPLEVETTGELTRGMTVIDQRRITTLKQNDTLKGVDVAFSIDRELFQEVFLETLGVNKNRR